MTSASSSRADPAVPANDPSPDDEIMAAARVAFMDEALDMLRLLEQGLLRMEQAPRDHDALHSAFRAAHTLKGAAGMFGLTCSHQIEGAGHVIVGLLRALADDYGALVVLEHLGTDQGRECISVHLLDQDHWSGKRFSLAAGRS